MSEQIDLGKSSTGLQPNIAGFLCYIGGWITGFIFLLIEKENKFVRFHALQSIIIFGLFNALLMFILPWIPAGRAALVPIFGLLSFILWIILITKSYQGEKFKLPVIGDIAEKNS